MVNMMSMKDRIEGRLLQDLAPERMRLENESYMHNVPEGAESHWNLIIVSKEFEGKPLIKRHRAVYNALGNEIRDGIHALTMKTLTPAEWEKAGGEAENPAPKCLGGAGK